jgi:hypothetical protein
MNKQTLLFLDNQCENALIDKNFHEQIKTWINDYQLLYREAQLTINTEIYLNTLLAEQLTIKHIILFLAAFQESK